MYTTEEEKRGLVAKTEEGLVLFVVFNRVKELKLSNCI